MAGKLTEHPVRIVTDSVELEGDLHLPAGAKAVVVFAHGSGSSRKSPRNRFVADVLHERGLGTLLFDLLTREEDSRYEARFDIDLLSDRLKGATGWLERGPETRAMKIGYFGASTGAAAALIAAADLGDKIGAVVSRGGRPDLAGHVLARVRAPTLLIVGADDTGVVDLNEEAHRALRCEKQLILVPGATHLFEEPGTLEEAARHAADWFVRRLSAGDRGSSGEL